MEFRSMKIILLLACLVALTSLTDGQGALAPASPFGTLLSIWNTVFGSGTRGSDSEAKIQNMLSEFKEEMIRKDEMIRKKEMIWKEERLRKEEIIRKEEMIRREEMFRKKEMLMKEEKRKQSLCMDAAIVLMLFLIGLYGLSNYDVLYLGEWGLVVKWIGKTSLGLAAAYFAVFCFRFVNYMQSELDLTFTELTLAAIATALAVLVIAQSAKIRKSKRNDRG